MESRSKIISIALVTQNRIQPACRSGNGKEDGSNTRVWGSCNKPAGEVFFLLRTQSLCYRSHQLRGPDFLSGFLLSLSFGSEACLRLHQPITVSSKLQSAGEQSQFRA